VPKLRQLSVSEATSRLKEMSLRTPSGAKLFADDVVVDSSPKELEWVEPGSVVELVVLRRVPTLKGKTMKEAQALLQARDLHAQFPKDQRPDDIVEDQVPKADLRIKPSDVVHLKLVRHSPPTGVTVPSVVHEAWKEATGDLQRQGWTWELAAGQQPRLSAYVYAQTPVAGTKLEHKSRIVLTPGVQIPDLSGKTARQVALALGALGLQAATAENVAGNDWHVLHNDPTSPPGQIVALGARVKVVVEVTHAPTGVTVPSVVHEAWKEATGDLQRQGWTWELAAGQQPRPSAYVYGQTPAAGTKLEHKRKIVLTPGVQIPDLSSKTARQVELSLGALGLQAATSGNVVGNDWHVLNNDPTSPPGQIVALGTRVKVVIEVTRAPMVPPVVGKTAAVAQQILREKNLLYRFVNDPAAGPVQRTEPAAGQLLASGKTVLLVFPVKHVDPVVVNPVQPPIHPGPVVNPVQPPIHPGPVGVNPPLNVDPVRPVPTPQVQNPSPSPPTNVAVPALVGAAFEEAVRRAQVVGLIVQQENPPLPPRPTSNPAMAGKMVVASQSINAQSMVPKGTTIKVQVARYVLKKH
jgi:beta-lactam-binding protein with PASTA domain